MSAPPGDYTHRRHVGNIGDVWKHIAWVATLGALTRPVLRPVSVIDTHSGEGAYRLGRTGEWTAGWGRVQSASLGDAVTALQRRVRIIEGLALPPAADGSTQQVFYPGSPVLTVGALRSGDHATFCEAHPDAATVLRRVLEDQPGVRVREGDGYAMLAEWAPDADSEALVLIDPAYGEREEWDRVPAAIAAARERIPGCRFVVWYPIKAFTRPHQLQHALRKAGIPATALDLVSTPIELRKNALAGSGVMLVNPPDGVVPGLVAAAAQLGPVLATRPPAWELRITAW